MPPQLFGGLLVRVGALAARIETALAKEAFAAGDRERHHNSVADLQVLHLGAEFDHDPHRFVPDHVARVHPRDDAVIHVEVGAADRRGGHLDDSVARVLDPGIGHALAAHVALAVPAECSHRRYSAAALPGCAFLRCCSASMSEGVMWAIAACNLFCQPVTTWPSPCIIASKPWRATSAGSSFFEVPTLVSI